MSEPRFDWIPCVETGSCMARDGERWVSCGCAEGPCRQPQELVGDDKKPETVVFVEHYCDLTLAELDREITILRAQLYLAEAASRARRVDGLLWVK